MVKMKFFSENPAIYQQFKNKRTILLINPHHHRNWKYKESIYSFPIGLLYLGTFLRQAGYKPKLIDTCVDPKYLDAIRAELNDTLYVGLSVMTPQISHAYEIAETIRQETSSVPIIWGGIHPSLYPASCLDDLCDVAVLGEGDQTSVDIADAITRQTDLAEIPGIAFKTDTGIVQQTSPRPLLSMADLPHVDYSLVDPEAYIESYVIQEQRSARTVPIHAARGCPWHCTFCINTTLNAERRYRPRPADSLLDEIESLATAFSLEGIILQDEEFFADRSRLMAFLDGIEDRKLTHLKYYATSRINHFRPGYIDRRFLKRLKRCGFVDLVFGFESGSRHCLEIIQKEITVEQGLYAAHLLAEEGFKSVWGFIMAIPGETRSDLLKTLNIMEKIRTMSHLNYFIGPQIFRPYPGSKLYRQALEHGLKEPGSLKEWSALDFTPEGWFGSNELPWIPEKDLNLIDYVNFIAPVYYNRQFLRSSWPVKVFHTILRAIFYLRLHLNIWSFPVEHRIRSYLLACLSRRSVKKTSHGKSSQKVD
jgi:radical SAM superfamily enzyme YgiQ (UPF0313 family)